MGRDMIGEVSTLSFPLVLPHNSQTKKLILKEARRFQDPDPALKQYLFSPTDAVLYLLLSIFNRSGTYDFGKD